MSVLVTESRAELGLEGEGENEKEVYPERPYEGDCFDYLRNGFCGFGSWCQFNHPRDRAGTIDGAMSGRHVLYPERIGRPVCQYYLQNKYCKFGAACKYHHPRQGTGSSSPATTTTTTTTYPVPPKQGMGFGSSSPVALNVFGYPLRPGEKECSYYVKTGQCKFGDTCKFHHPQTTTIVPSTAPAVSSGQLFPMHSAIYQNVQLPAHLAVSPNPQPILGGGSVYAPYSLTNSQKENVFPERPGEPEYQQCVFGFISPMGLPLRPGAHICLYYRQNGFCRFGLSCIYDHPMGPNIAGQSLHNLISQLFTLSTLTLSC